MAAPGYSQVTLALISSVGGVIPSMAVVVPSMVGALPNMVGGFLTNHGKLIQFRQPGPDAAEFSR